MSQFIATVTTVVNAYSAESAADLINRAIREGRSAGYLGNTVDVVSVEPYVAPRTYTQAEFDAAVLAAAENARQNALAGTFE